jgi:hypothetical protein
LKSNPARSAIRSASRCRERGIARRRIQLLIACGEQQNNFAAAAGPPKRAM